MHAYNLFPKKVASPSERLARRHEVEGRIGVGGSGSYLQSRAPRFLTPEPPELCMLLWLPLLAFLGWVYCS